MAVSEQQHYARPGHAEDARAVYHHQQALDALEGAEPEDVAMLHAILALAERVSELSCYVARLG